MKKSPRFYAIVLYPYLFMIGIAILALVTPFFEDVAIGATVVFGIGLIFTIYSIIKGAIAISNAANDKLDSVFMARRSLFIKSAHIPAYLIHFALGVIGTLMSIWGIGLILYALLLDFLTIIVSGLIGVASAIACKKEGHISTGECVLFSILSFIYVGDFIAAIVLRKKVKNIGAGSDCHSEK